MLLNAFLNRDVNVYNFNPATSIPDLRGKVIIVTGGNAGLGLYSIIELAQHNPYRIYLTARSQAKFDTAMTEIRKHVAAADGVICFVEMDLSSFASVKVAAERILSDTDRIDVLMNNAGIMGASPGLTNEGYEVHFGTNHMGHALFTRLLMPTLLKTAETSDVRIVNVSSGAYATGSVKTGIDTELVKTDMASISDGMGNVLPRYSQSKLANVLHAKGLAKHYPSVTSVSIAPGRVKTQLLDSFMAGTENKVYKYFQKFYDRLIGTKEPEIGVYNQVWAATEPKKERLKNGALYAPIAFEDKGTKHSNDGNLVDKLWDFTENEFKQKGY